MSVVVDRVEGRVEPPRQDDRTPQEPNQAATPVIGRRELERHLCELERRRCRLMAD